MLIISSVGNDGLELTKDNVIEDGVLPASLTPRSCRRAGLDPIVRIGATNCYSSLEDIDIHKIEFSGKGSNYGSEYVDILAPGAKIPLIYDKNSCILGSGTSESAAIVTGVLSLMMACRPFESAYSLKEALLADALKLNKMNAYVRDGNVLNIYHTVKNYCVTSPNQSIIFSVEIEADGNNIINMDNSQMVKFAENKKMLKDKEDKSNNNQPQSMFLNIICIILPAFILGGLFKICCMRCPHPGVAREEY